MTNVLGDRPTHTTKQPSNT